MLFTSFSQLLWNQPNTHVLITNQEMMISSLLTSSESLSLMSTLMDIQELPGFVAQIECRLLIGLILLPISSCLHCEFSLNEHMFDSEHFQNVRYLLFYKQLPCTINVCQGGLSKKYLQRFKLIRQYMNDCQTLNILINRWRSMH